jgi:hypothetical protein
MRVLRFLILSLTAIALADDFKLVSGKEYKNSNCTRLIPLRTAVTTAIG